MALRLQNCGIYVVSLSRPCEQGVKTKHTSDSNYREFETSAKDILEEVLIFLEDA